MTRSLPLNPAVLARRVATVVLVLTACAFAAAPASAATVIGFGEQSPAIFADARWQALDAPHVRLIVGWDALDSGWQRREIDDYMTTAHHAGANVLLSFSRSRVAARRKVLPSVARYRAAFAAFRARYPFVTEFVTWNEANLCGQPTCARPAVTAQYYNAMRASCRSCTILAPSVLDTPNMTKWVRAFERAARGAPPTWGLHNYVDANAFRTTGTKAMLRATKGKIWLTETGGIVARSNRSALKFAEGTAHAARAMTWLFTKLLPLSRRIQRAYVYHWTPAARKDATWDSAVIDRLGRPRRAYFVVAKAVRQAAASPRRP